MKLFAVLAVGLVLALTLSKALDIRQQIRHARRACFLEVKLSVEDRAKAYRWNYAKNSSHPLMCFLKCTAVKLGIVDSALRLQAHRADEVLSNFNDEDDIHANVKTCKDNESVKDGCLKVDLLYNCLTKSTM